MNEIIFEVEDATEGRYTAHALGASIYTDAEALTIIHTVQRDFGEMG